MPHNITGSFRVAPGDSRRSYSARLPVRPAYRHVREPAQTVNSAAVTPIEENASWTSIVPPGATRAPQCAMSPRAGPKRCAPSTNSTAIWPETSACASDDGFRTCRTRSSTPADSRLARNAT